MTTVPSSKQQHREREEQEQPGGCCCRGKSKRSSCGWSCHFLTWKIYYILHGWSVASHCGCTISISISISISINHWRELEVFSLGGNNSATATTSTSTKTSMSISGNMEQLVSLCWRRISKTNSDSTSYKLWWVSPFQVQAIMTNPTSSSSKWWFLFLLGEKLLQLQLQLQLHIKHCYYYTHCYCFITNKKKPGILIVVERRQNRQ